jgi:hypothetical protein
VPEPPHVLKFQVPRIIKINMGLRDAADQQHPRPRPVQVAQQLDAAIPITLATTWPGTGPLTIRHNGIVQRPGCLHLSRPPASSRATSIGLGWSCPAVLVGTVT